MTNPQAGTMAAGGGAGAFVVILVWVLSLFNLSVPSDVAAAIVTVVTMLAAFIVHRLPPVPTP